MAKDKQLNPVEAARRKEKAKELKRNRDLRKQHRDVALHQMTADTIREEIHKISRMERSKLADQHALQRKKKLEEELVEAQKRDQARREEERRRAAQQPLVIKGLDKIIGADDDKRPEPDAEDMEEEAEEDELEEKAAGTADTSIAAAATGAGDGAAAPSPPAGMRVWLEEPPGLKRPPYMPAFARSADAPLLIAPSSLSAPADALPLVSASVPLIAPSSITATPLIAPSAMRAASSLPPAPVQHGPYGSRLPPTSSFPSSSSSYQPIYRPPPPRPSPYPLPTSSASSSPPEIDPMDPNPDAALDQWKKERERISRRHGGGAGAQATEHAAGGAQLPPAAAAPRPVQRPAFVPTNVLVKNRPQPAAEMPRPNVSRPVNVTVNPAPSVSSAPSAPSAGSVQSRAAPSAAELEYQRLMRELGEDG